MSLHGPVGGVGGQVTHAATVALVSSSGPDGPRAGLSSKRLGSEEDVYGAEHCDDHVDEAEASVNSSNASAKSSRRAKRRVKNRAVAAISRSSEIAPQIRPS